MRWWLAAAIGLYCLPALAQPPAEIETDTSVGAWYQSLKVPGSVTPGNPNGISCCDLSDCGPVESRIEGDHYQILMDKNWVDVPPEKVLIKDNPTGHAVACLVAGMIWCFVPADLF